jgi:hypothetical protein
MMFLKPRYGICFQDKELATPSNINFLSFEDCGDKS